jgi:hypothetical protein
VYSVRHENERTRKTGANFFCHIHSDIIFVWEDYSISSTIYLMIHSILFILFVHSSSGTTSQSVSQSVSQSLFWIFRVSPRPRDCLVPWKIGIRERERELKQQD